jgi:hypothetical protein
MNNEGNVLIQLICKCANYTGKLLMMGEICK